MNQTFSKPPKERIIDVLATAYGYFCQGEPFPVDLEMRITAVGYDPDSVRVHFENGIVPSDYN